MRVLGVDPGLACTGLALLEGDVVAATAGVRTSPKQSLPARLLHIQEALIRFCDEHRPGRAAMEQTIFARNAGTALLLGAARGAVMTALARLGLPVVELPPDVIKQSFTGRGHASKGQMIYMAKTRFSLTTEPTEHEADAIAAACALINRDRVPAG